MTSRVMSRQRRDIQGLRAFAVGVVFLEHLFGWPHGGFAGVDIFFVISGFLITSMLLNQYERTGTISFLHFYAGRAKRILPAATLTLAVTAVIGGLLFSAQRATAIGWDAFWAFVFAANWNFLHAGTDYFLRDAAVSPLQHYWSLSVEEQFYFVWPWLLLGLLTVCAKLTPVTPRRLRVVAGWAASAIIAISFIWALVQSVADPTPAYFSTFTRSWELALGALIAVLAPLFTRMTQPVRITLLYVGLAGMVATLFVVDSTSTWPAPGALLPTVATGLVLVSGIGEEARGNPLLTNRAAVYIGDISYSLYLWHFPAIIFIGALIPRAGAWDKIAIVLTAFATAIVAYHAFENPIHRSPLWTPKASPTAWSAWRSRQRRPAGIALVIGAVGVAATLVVASIVPSRSPTSPPPPSVGSTEARGDLMADVQSDLAQAIAAEQWPDDIQDQMSASGYGDPLTWSCANPATFTPEGCWWGEGERTAVLVGDSIANSYLPVIASILEPRGWRVRQMTLNGCEFNTIVLAAESSAEHCADRVAAGIEAAHEADLVFVSGQWARHIKVGGTQPISFAAWWSGLQSALEELAPTPTIYLAPPPWQQSIDSCYTALAAPADCISHLTGSWTRSDEALRAYDAETDGFEYVSTGDWYCVESECPALARGLLTRRDKLHPGMYYLEAIKPAIAEALEPRLPEE
ncbi:acyltransferase family protein [Microbacterium paludicola]|uniref:acyltransferase family protein n=1 Tax=Microbacterium paludicola TaxID=300019 RepID=UPI0031D1155B